jgi:hypothetical protein
MGLFSRKPTEVETTLGVISLFSSYVMKYEDNLKSKIAPTLLAGFQHFVESFNWSEADKLQTVTMFEILTGTVDVQANKKIKLENTEIYEMVTELLPTEIPMMVFGPLRMVIEEFVTGKEMKDIDYNKFELTNSRKVIDSLMETIKVINERCLTNPKLHPRLEIDVVASLCHILSNYIKVQIFSNEKI